MYAGVTARVSYNNCAQAGGKEHGAVNKGTRANIGMSSQDTGVERQATQEWRESAYSCGSQLYPLQDMFVSTLTDSVDEATSRDM